MNILKKTIYLTLIAIFVVACKSGNEGKGVWSEWVFQNRGDNTYLYDDGGICKNGTDGYTDAAKWITEAAGKYTRLKNKKTGNYLRFNKEKDALEIVQADSADLSTHWQYGGYDWDHMANCGWYNLSNRELPDRYLKIDDGVKMLKTDINKDLSAHWTINRVAGSDLPFEITANEVKEASFLGLREARYVSDQEIMSNYNENGKTWKRELEISQFPKLKADNHKLLVALYNMSLEEMQLVIRKQDTTFQAGALWPDTWTRDAVYAIHLAYNYLLPDVSKKTLEKQTLKNPREALQDTGSGGSWPISTDRVVWAIAAWEYYLTSGDRQWLEECYSSLSYTAEKDIHVAFDPSINLFKGETASMDWRTHTYPNWFTNASIGESFSSATNALHSFLYGFLAQAGTILGKPETEISKWTDYSNKVKEAINKYFWMEEQGYYSEYMYPQMEGHYVSQRGGCMSSGLCMTLGVTDVERSKVIASKFPMFPYGAPTLYPSIPDDFAYHNKGIWPVWESYLMLGMYKAGNVEATEHIMKSIVRQAALFLTNKENMTYDTGYNVNTALNSDRQLWSVASYIGLFYRIIFGMELTPDGMSFKPSIPDQFYGPFELSEFKFRDAELDIIVNGSGNIITEVLLDGEKQDLAFTLPFDVKGKHKIEITVKKGSKNKFTLVEAGPAKCWSPVEPVITLNGDKLEWKQEDGLKYMLWDGKSAKEVKSPTAISLLAFGVYNIYSVDAKGFQSDLSNSIVVAPDTYRYEAEDAKNTGSFNKSHAGYSGRGFVVDLAKKTANLTFTVDVPAGKSGKYALKLVGANGHGPDGTYCAIRSVIVDRKDSGTFIMEATGDWNRWMNSNRIFVDLAEGEHTIELRLNPENRGFDNNMSHNKENANDLNIDYLEVMKM